MTSEELREKFIEYFEKLDHKRIPSFSVVPENDPSVLFTTAGMHPLVPYLMGEKHPLGKRLVDSQKCLRTVDIDEVGDASHLTFFEMLGYWSLGDYFKEESIKYTFGFYTEVLGFERDKISVSVFEGDKDAPFDETSYKVWRDVIGIPEERIYKYPKKENWWGPAAETGPCGPDTEMFVDTGAPKCGPNCGPACSCGKFIEIGNNVFMEYFKDAEGKFEKLAQQNVDVGIGLERLVMFSQGKDSVFETDLFKAALAKINELSKAVDKNERSVRIIADHLRAVTFVLAEGVEPSNIDRGYIVRRLIRRAVRHGRVLGIEHSFTKEIASEYVKKMGKIYPELLDNEQFIYSELEKEEAKFRHTLENGLKKFNQIVSSKKEAVISGQEAFDLFQSYGFPVEMTLELAEEKGLQVDQAGFEEEFKKHQEKSRLGAEKKFKGGLGDQSTETVRYHTAAHLMLEALRRVLGPHVSQRGANITAERMRFDFSHPEKVTPEEIAAVEKMVNKMIAAKLPVLETVTTVEEAKGNGATGVFDSKYGEKVKVYTIGGALDSEEAFSKEICGGPHVQSTGELGHFKIVKEESSSAGVRRIKAVLE